MATVRVIAECGQTHGGDVQRALDEVEAFADAGAAGVKFQWVDPEQIATVDAVAYWHDIDGVASRGFQRDTYARSGDLTVDEWYEVAARCRQRDVEFIVTPFDFAAVARLRAMIDAGLTSIVKVASGDITFLPLLDLIAKAGFSEVILSSGGATRTEIVAAERRLHRGEYDQSKPMMPVTVLACSLVYPCPAEHANLARIDTLRHFVLGDVGYSDHTREEWTGYAAAAAGATTIEKHVTITPDDDSNPDNALGLTPAEFERYVGGCESGARLRGDEERLGVDDSEYAAHIGARRSARWAHDMTIDDPVTWSSVTWQRPCEEDGRSIALADRALRDRMTVTRPCDAGTLVCDGDFVVRST